MAGEQHEHAAVRRAGEIGHHLGQRGAVADLVLPRLGQIGGDAEQALGRKVERRREDLPHRDRRVLAREPEPRLEELELAAGGERGAREQHGVEPVEQELAEDRREIQRDGVKRDVLPPRGTLEPAHRGAARPRPDAGCG